MKNKAILLTVLLPLVVFAYYQLFMAARIYEAEGRFVVKQASEEPAGLDLGLSLLGGAPSTSREDAALAVEFIQSPNLLALLDGQLGLREHYQATGMDLLRYFPADASKEDFLKRYRKMVQVKIDPETNVVVLTVHAYEPETAQTVAAALMREGEAFINRISEEMAREQVAFVEVEVAYAEKRLRSIRESLLQFQDVEMVLDPTPVTEAALGLVAGLEEKLVQEKAERIRLLSFMKADAPEVVANLQLVQSLEEQLAKEKARLTGAGAETLNRKLARFKELQLDSEFAVEAYKAGFASLEKARLDASRKLKHFVMISTTGLPEEPAYPRVLYNLLTALVVLLLLYGVIRLVIATVQDHRI